MQRWIPLLVSSTVVPKSSAKVVLGEEELLCCPLVLCGEDAVVANQGLELASKIMPLNPIYPHVSMYSMITLTTKTH
jgi:hypothetical protein